MPVITNEKYVRCDLNNNPVTVPHKEVTQKESCLTYRIFNQEYERRDKDCNLVAADKQPDIKEGWNGDYVRVFVDTGIVRTSQQLVEQSVYNPTDKDNNNLAAIICFVDPPLGFVIGSFDSIIMEQDQNYYFVTENTDMVIVIEDSTVIPEVMVLSADGTDEQVVDENGIPIELGQNT